MVRVNSTGIVEFNKAFVIKLLGVTSIATVGEATGTWDSFESGLGMLLLKLVHELSSKVFLSIRHKSCNEAD